MDQIESVDTNSSVATVQSGVILERLDSALRSEHGLMVPLDLGAKGSCHIGGNVSTNAGGLRLVRYGNLHGSVMGVEAVLADGRVLDCLSPLKKGEFSEITRISHTRCKLATKVFITRVFCPVLILFFCFPQYSL